MYEAAEYCEVVIKIQRADPEYYFYNSQRDDWFATDTVGSSVAFLNVEDFEHFTALHQLFTHT